MCFIFTILSSHLSHCLYWIERKHWFTFSWDIDFIDICITRHTRTIALLSPYMCYVTTVDGKSSFLMSKDVIMNIDKFLISILFSVFISSINFGIFNIVQWNCLIYVFFLIPWNNGYSSKTWNSSSQHVFLHVFH